MVVAGIEKKAAVGGGEASGVVDLAVGWVNGDGISSGPRAPGNTPLVRILPGETRITGGADVCCTVCTGFGCVDV